MVVVLDSSTLFCFGGAVARRPLVFAATHWAVPHLLLNLAPNDFGTPPDAGFFGPGRRARQSRRAATHATVASVGRRRLRTMRKRLLRSGYQMHGRQAGKQVWVVLGSLLSVCLVTDLLLCSRNTQSRFAALTQQLS